MVVCMPRAPEGSPRAGTRVISRGLCRQVSSLDRAASVVARKEELEESFAKELLRRSFDLEERLNLASISRNQAMKQSTVCCTVHAYLNEYVTSVHG